MHEVEIITRVEFIWFDFAGHGFFDQGLLGFHRFLEFDKEKFQDKGKEHFPKISVVATEATKPAADQPREIPQVPTKPS